MAKPSSKRKSDDRKPARAKAKQRKTGATTRTEIYDEDSTDESSSQSQGMFVSQDTSPEAMEREKAGRGKKGKSVVRKQEKAARDEEENDDNKDEDEDEAEVHVIEEYSRGEKKDVRKTKSRKSEPARSRDVEEERGVWKGRARKSEPARAREEGDEDDEAEQDRGKKAIRKMKAKKAEVVHEKIDEDEDDESEQEEVRPKKSSRKTKAKKSEQAQSYDDDHEEDEDNERRSKKIAGKPKSRKSEPARIHDGDYDSDKEESSKKVARKPKSRRSEPARAFVEKQKEARVERSAKKIRKAKSARAPSEDDNNETGEDKDENEDEGENEDEAEENKEQPIKKLKPKGRQPEPISARCESEEDEEQEPEAKGEKITTKPVHNANRRKAESMMSRPKDSEYEEDNGRMESQQFLMLVEVAAGAKHSRAKDDKQYFADFDAMLSTGEKDLKSQLKSLRSTSIKKDEDFRQEFKTLFSSVAPFTKDEVASANKLGHFSALYDQSKKLATGAENLIAKFESACQEIAGLNTEALISNGWAEKDEKLRQLLLEGKEVGMRKYKKLLNPTKDKKENMEPEVEDPAMLAVEGMFFKKVEGEEAADEGIWDKVARKHEKAAKKLVKAFSLDFE